MSDTNNNASSLTSDSEFDLVKRVQVTNEVPPSSLYSLLPTGLRNDFWKYFIGTSEIAYDVPVGGVGTDMYSTAMKTVNGVQSTTYGPATAGENFHSININGAIEPEIDLFLHELYRYLGHLYPDHPDYEMLLTPIEINDAIYAAAAIIGYAPDYKFLEMWSQSITGTALTREELKWKIRDLRGAAYRRKFAGSYGGYKIIFSSMYRHGSVYSTATYLPKAADNSLDNTSENLFRIYRLIDYLGVGDDTYRQSSQVTFNGLVDPSDLFHIYEVEAYTADADASAVPTISFGAFVQDKEKVLVPSLSGSQSGVTVQAQSTAPVGYSDYLIHRIQASNRVQPSARAYTFVHAGVTQPEPIYLTPRAFGDEGSTATTLGRFSLPLITALPMYPTEAVPPMTEISSIPFGGTYIATSDTFIDNYIANAVFPRSDIALVTSLKIGKLVVRTNPSAAPVVVSIPPKLYLSGGLNIQIPQYSEAGVTYTHVFVEGALTYEVGSGNTLLVATLDLRVIPEVNPITGETNNRELILLDDDDGASIVVGNYADICVYNTNTSKWEAVPQTYGWVDSIDYGYLEAQELSRDGSAFANNTPQAFILSSFEAWKLRAGSSFVADMVDVTATTITGTIAAGKPMQIDLVGGPSMSMRAQSLSAGETIFGPGLPSNTIVTGSNSSSIGISKASARFGTFTYSVTTQRGGGASSEGKVFDFKNTLYSRFPALTTSAFQFLWPSSVWPYTSQGYLEGVRDTSMYSYPTELPEGVSRPANIFFNRDIFLDLSLDRVLYHPNTLELVTNNQYLCLCDLPWLDYVLSYASKAKRASEQVHVGAQLTMSTDTSGLYSVKSGLGYTDPSIQSKFITLPQYYKNNPHPAYIQIGTGGAARDTLFVSIDDLIRPTIFGSAFYDQTGRDELSTEKRRSLYLANGGGLSSSGSSTIDAAYTTLESPLFEVPVGEYENLLGPGVTDNLGNTTYTDGLASPSNPTNTYHTIQSTIYSQQYKNIGVTLQEADSLILNSPALFALKRLPDSYTYKGDWIPSTKLGSTTIPNWPIPPGELDRQQNHPDQPAITFNNNDYFVVAQASVIGTYTFNIHDWIIWNDVSHTWVTKTWVLQGLITGTTANTPPLSDFLPAGTTPAQLIATQFPYYIFDQDCTVQYPDSSTHAVLKNDWLILTNITGSSPNYTLTWNVANGQSYDTLYSNVSRDIISTSEYNTITQNRIVSIDSTVYTYLLPRHFLAKGSCNFRFKINPKYNALDTDGGVYALTDEPILWDSTAQLFYVQGTAIDDLLVNNIEPFFIENTIQLQAKSSVEPTRHYVKFREPTYFKNLGMAIGVVNVTSPNIVTGIDGFAFPISQLSLTDTIESGLEIQIRNNYSSAFENTYLNHYVTLRGMPSQSDASLLKPITGTGTSRDASFLAEFSAAMTHLSVSDQAQIFQPAIIRQYDTSYENVYYKNLLAVAGKVKKADPTTLYPIGTGADDIRAFTDAVNLTTAGDSSNGVYTLGGAVFTVGSNALPISVGNNGMCVLTAECNQSTPLLWMIGGVNGQIAKSTDGVTWTAITTLPLAWGTSAIKKIRFALNAQGVGQWRIVGESGKCAYSLNDGTGWFMDALTGTGWDTSSINDLQYLPGTANNSTPGTWVIVGDGGKCAYLGGEYATESVTWTMSALPGTDGIPVALPPGAPASIPPGTQGVPSGWGTDPARAIANGNGVWMIGGGNFTTGTSVVSLLARSTNLTPSSGAAWTFAFLGTDWNDNYITSVRYGDGIWVVGGINGKLAYSTNDGLAWTTVSMPTDWAGADVMDVRYEYGVWTIVGGLGKVANSIDGITWTMGTAPSALGTANLRASAHGKSSTNGVEHLVVGDANHAAYSNSTVQSVGTLTVTYASASSLSIQFDSDITAWDTGDSTDKIVLVTINTKTSVECELIGIPTARYAAFSINDALVLSGAVVVTTAGQANRVYYPHLNPSFDLVPHSTLTSAQIRATAGYPLYSEDATMYYKNASGNPINYVNTNKDTLYLCNASGAYVTGQYTLIPVSAFLAYTSGNQTRFSDSRQPSYTPRYAWYSDWIAKEGAIYLGTAGATVTTVKTLTTGASPSVDFLSDLPTLTTGYNGYVVTILPMKVLGTVSSIAEPTYVSNAKLSNAITGMYMPDGGYGTWVDFDHTTDASLPWEADPSAFKSPLVPLVNINNSPVYLCNADGTYRKANNVPIQMKAPKYLTMQDLIVNDGRIIEHSALAFTESLSIIYTDATANTVKFSDSLPLAFEAGETTKYVRLHLLTLASFEPSSSTPNDSRLIEQLTQTSIVKYTPDRVCYDDSAYPTYEADPSLYSGDTFINRNSINVYSCDASGNYVDSSKATTSLLSARVQPHMPVHMLCQDWYRAEEYIEGQENNPYWQYITLKDTLNPKSKLWVQEAKTSMLKKSEKGTQLLYADITDGSDYLSIQPGLQYESTLSAFEVTPANYIDYMNGKLSMIMLGNSAYDTAWREAQNLPPIEEAFEKYGITFIPNFEIANIASLTQITHSAISGDLISNYYVNTTRNFANPQDKKGSVVAITEMGVFNTDGNMIAYATFPPIIYDSVRHHLSLNLFIKQGEFTAL